jgi:hypothetical protein
MPRPASVAAAKKGLDGSAASGFIDNLSRDREHFAKVVLAGPNQPDGFRRKLNDLTVLPFEKRALRSFRDLERGVGQADFRRRSAFPPADVFVRRTIMRE